MRMKLKPGDTQKVLVSTIEIKVSGHAAIINNRDCVLLSISDVEKELLQNKTENM